MTNTSPIALDPMFAIGNINGAMKYFDRISSQFDEAISEATDVLRTHISAVTAERDAMKEDAERWRALAGSARLEWMGCSGFDFGDGSKPIKDCDVTPRDGQALHFAMSFWSEFPAKEIPSGHAFAVRFLTAYADACRARGEKRPALCSDCPPAGYPTDETRCAECPRRTQP